MAERDAPLGPTLTVRVALCWSRGGRPGLEPERITRARATFRQALAAGVMIGNGSDSGAFARGERARELELLGDFRMRPPDVRRAATAVAAGPPTWTIAAGRWGRGCGPTSSPSRATRRAISPRCAGCGSS